MTGHLDAHAKPPPRLREIYKDFQKLKLPALALSPDLIGFDDAGKTTDARLQTTKTASLPAELRQVFLDFLDDKSLIDPAHSPSDDIGHAVVYEIPNVPGKQSRPFGFHRSEIGRSFHLPMSLPIVGAAISA